MNFTPHSYQQDIIDHINSHNRSFVIAAAGAGKTAAVLSTLKPSKRTLIVAPLRVAKHTWPDEIDKWDFGLEASVVVGTASRRTAALNTPADVYIVNVESLVWLLDNDTDFDCVVIDESSLFKSPSSKRFKALAKWIKSRSTLQVILMTATPTPNGLLDAWSQMYLLDQGERLGRKFYAYKQRYFYPTDFKGYKWKAKPHTDDFVRSSIAEVATVVENYAGLPDIVQLNEYVDMPEMAWRDYEAMRKDFMVDSKREDLSAANAAVMVGKLAQIASGACLDDDRCVIDYHRAKLDALKEIVESTNENLLVAYNWVHDFERLSLTFPDAVSITEPGAIERWNDGEISMLLAHPKSAGHGLNLQGGGRRIVWYSPTWSNEMKIQFDARLYRQGQKDKVFVHTLIAQDTIDEEILEVVGTRKTMQDLLIASVKRLRRKKK